MTESDAAEQDWLGRNGPFDDCVCDNSEGRNDDHGGDRATFPVRRTPGTDGVRARWDRYLSTLLIDSRDGSRAGFPAQVAGQFARLFALAASPIEGATPGRRVATATVAANASAPPASAGPAEARAPQGPPSLTSIFPRT